MGASVPCAGGIVFDRAGRLLLIQRGHEPARGTWSLPGGRCHAGESPQQACVRELAEETGLTVRVLRLAGRVRRPGVDGVVYEIDDFVCAVVSESATADDPATPDLATDDLATPDLATADATADDPAAKDLVAGDDADDARWVSRADFAGLPLAQLLAETLREWDCLPRC